MTTSTANETTFVKVPSEKKVIITRLFNAPLAKVWRSWTDSSQLSQWWAPRPWKAETQTMDFTPGGAWIYAMRGPNGEQHCAYNKISFHTIEPEKSFTSTETFYDEHNQHLDSFPTIHWKVEFSAVGNTTKVNIEVWFDTEAAFEKMVEFGLKNGFTQAFGNLDELLAE